MKKRKILMLLIIILGMFIFFRNISFNNISYRLNKFVSKITNTSEYKTIKQDINKNYSGIGQEKVKNKDGYFTTFTTIENHKKTYIEYKQKLNINKMLILLGVIINIGVVLWQKMAVALLHLQLF